MYIFNAFMIAVLVVLPEDWIKFIDGSHSWVIKFDVLKAQLIQPSPLPCLR